MPKSLFKEDLPTHKAYLPFLRANSQLIGKLGPQPFSARDLWGHFESTIIERHAELANSGGNHAVVTGALMNLAADLQQALADRAVAPTNPEYLKRNPELAREATDEDVEALLGEAEEVIASDAPQARYFYVAHGKITHEITHEDPLAHARLSASSSKRWLGCPASPKMEDKYPDTSSFAAEEGTVAHRICELCLNEGRDASAYVGYWVDPKTEELYEKDPRASLDDDGAEPIEVTVEMADYVQMYVDTINEREYDEFMVETRVDYSSWVPKNSGILICYYEGHAGGKEETRPPEAVLEEARRYFDNADLEFPAHFRWRAEGFGTSDFIGIKGTTCYVDDFKYGKGVWVDAEDNSQMKLYGLGVYAMFNLFYGIEKFVLSIHQPRLDNFSTWEITTEDLLQWADQVLVPGSEACLSDNPPFNPGDACNFFCKAVGDCKAAANYNLTVVGDELAFAEADEQSGGMTPLEYAEELPAGELPLKDPDQLDNEQLGRLLQHVDGIEAWCKAIEARVTDELNRGEAVPGYKLVEGRSKRVWKDEQVAGKFLLRECKLGEDEIFTKKMITGPQAEKLLGKKHPEYKTLQGLMDKPAGKPVVAPESDKREAIAAKVEAELDL